jgi:hypothetical protein
MTGQIHDTFKYKKKNCDISGIENPDKFFHFEKLGISPTPTSSACWRGYIACFTINDDNLLVLKHLNTNNGNVAGRIPEINGKAPDEIPHMGLADEYTYDRYVHMGFQSPLSYKIVFELGFENGVLIRETNLSKLAKAQRKNTPKIDEEEKWRNLPKWIDDQFDLSYIRFSDQETTEKK